MAWAAGIRVRGRRRRSHRPTPGQEALWSAPRGPIWTPDGRHAPIPRIEPTPRHQRHRVPEGETQPQRRTCVARQARLLRPRVSPDTPACLPRVVAWLRQAASMPRPSTIRRILRCRIRCLLPPDRALPSRSLAPPLFAEPRRRRMSSRPPVRAMAATLRLVRRSPGRRRSTRPSPLGLARRPALPPVRRHSGTLALTEAKSMRPGPLRQPHRSLPDLPPLPPRRRLSSGMLHGPQRLSHHRSVLRGLSPPKDSPLCGVSPPLQRRPIPDPTPTLPMPRRAGATRAGPGIRRSGRMSRRRASPSVSLRTRRAAGAMDWRPRYPPRSLQCRPRSMARAPLMGWLQAASGRLRGACRQNPRGPIGRTALPTARARNTRAAPNSKYLGSAPDSPTGRARAQPRTRHALMRPPTERGQTVGRRRP